MGSWYSFLRFDRAETVQEDWRAWLPAEKETILSESVSAWTTDYSMLSVVLNDALAQDIPRLPNGEHAGICAQLFDRLVLRLETVLRTLEEYGRYLAAVPQVIPLDPHHFRGAFARNRARRSDSLLRYLFSSRSSYARKLLDILEISSNLAEEFRMVAEQVRLQKDGALSPGWAALEMLHYDLNTCFQETCLVFKSFLRLLPVREVPSFRSILAATGDAVSRRPREAARPLHLVRASRNM